MKVLPLVGSRSLQAFSAFCKLLLGLKMTPAHLSEPYEEFFASFGEKTQGEKETMVRLAVALVDLESREIEALLCFATDKNGVPISAVNLSKMPVKEIFEAIVAVGMELGRIDIHMVTPEEKKKSEHSPST